VKSIRTHISEIVTIDAFTRQEPRDFPKGRLTTGVPDSVNLHIAHESSRSERDCYHLHSRKR
jgi:hypothetical protein